MMKVEHLSIRRKLALISVLSTGGALLVMFATFAATSVMSNKAEQRKQLLALAAVIGVNSVEPLLFDERRLGEQTLRALGMNHDITQAALFDRDGKLFARYVAGGAHAPDAPPDLAPRDDDGLGAIATMQDLGPFWALSIRTYQPVMAKQKTIGAVMIEVNLAPMWMGIMRLMTVVAAATVLSFLIAVFLAGRFRRVIAEPIATLIEAARQVSSSQIYNHHIDHRRGDELGVLIDSFNDMLSQIESRDASLASYRDQLERQVDARTEQLEKAKNAAEAASRAKSAFLATMSHEIRTPMNGVLGMTELLLASDLNQQQRHYTAMVKRSGENLLVIINDILDFSKIEAGKLSVEYIHFNFRELLDDLDHVFAPQAEAKGIRLEFSIANDIPIAICGDPNRLRQVLVNLLGNAIKFTETGEITVKVRVVAEDAQSVGLRFEVHDTGIGVSSEAQTRIFDSFSQADGSTTRKHGGTGLGLTISKQLVELMGGKIGVDNALTQGSIFWFAVNFDKRRVDIDDPSFNHTTARGIRALIVDENRATRELLEGQLAGWRIAADSAASADEALLRLREAAARGQPYGVALLDMELARTSGLALAATIKAEAGIADIRLLLLSSEARAADTVQRRAAGVAFQLIKPARACDLYDCIVTQLRASEGVRLAAPRTVRPAAPRKRRRVLLAEDNRVNVEVAAAMLDGLGLDVVCAENGVLALAAARDEDFDLILMDCQMPVMDGFAATAEIRRLESQRGHARALPIVAITANALQGDREACLAAGMDDYLSKPFTQQELGKTMARWIPLPRAATVHHAEPAFADSARRPAPTAPTACAAPALPSAPMPTASPAAPPLATPAPLAPGRDIINRHALDNIRALSASGGDALLQRVIHAYVDDTPQQFQNLRLAIDTLDTDNIRKAAHSLKSSSANVGAEALARMCKEMETLGRGDTTEGASGILIDMEQEFQAVRHSLSAILEREI